MQLDNKGVYYRESAGYFAHVSSAAESPQFYKTLRATCWPGGGGGGGGGRGHSVM